jgi:hypothetical protein
MLLLLLLWQWSTTAAAAAALGPKCLPHAPLDLQGQLQAQLQAGARGGVAPELCPLALHGHQGGKGLLPEQL